MLHTSDVHIAGDQGSIAGLRGVVDTAVECDVDIVLIAGDLFDSSRVHDDAVAETVGELRPPSLPSTPFENGVLSAPPAETS